MEGYIAGKSGDYSGEDTPVPISNTVVKLLSADDTWREAAWKSRSLPVFLLWPHGQVVKTSPFHGGNPGSSPGGVTTRDTSSEVFFFIAVSPKPLKFQPSRTAVLNRIFNIEVKD